jgi:lysine-N-methylase
MPLPIVLLPNEEKWDCHQCGFCCRGSLIPLSNFDAEQLRKQNWEQEPQYRSKILVGSREAESGFRLAHRSDGSCVFLNDDGLCKIHAKFGITAKPTVCQTFPLQLIAHEKQAILTLRRACPSAANDLGSEATTQLPFIKQLVRDGRLKAEATTPPLLKPVEGRNWKTIQSVLDSAGTLLQDERYPPVRRLVHALQFANLLQAAKTKPMSDAQIVELAQTLAELAPEESKPLFDDRQPPKAYAKILFRLAAIYIARLHPQARHQSTWSARFQLIKTGWKVIRGTGQTPKIDEIFPTANMAELEVPLGVLKPEIYLPLTRFLETNAGSSMYAISDRQSWSVVDSIRALAIRYPIALWLLRWLTHGRQPTTQDMLHIICALDRSQGYEPLCGLNHRSRLSMLAANSELERLVVWYAR